MLNVLGKHATAALLQIRALHLSHIVCGVMEDFAMTPVKSVQDSCVRRVRMIRHALLGVKSACGTTNIWTATTPAPPVLKTRVCHAAPKVRAH